MKRQAGKCCAAVLAALFLLVAGSAWALAADIDVVELTIEQARADLKNKKYTSAELTKAFLERIDKYNPGYNAIIIMNPDAIKEAEAIDKRLAAGEKIGPLAGIPVVIKDTIDVAGLATTAGWKPMCAKFGGKDIIPTFDAPVTARLRAAGAVILGKTNVPPMSLDGTNANNSCFGPTYNAVDPRYAPGASSSGTATAVSASFAIAGLAEETGGSIQNPGAAQALVSIKPTFALVPNSGVVPCAGSTLDVVGPHTKTVHDAAVMLDVMAGFTAEDFKTVAAYGNIPKDGYTAGLKTDALKGKRIGLYGPGWKKIDLSPETRDLYQKAIAELKARGAIVVEDPFAGSDFAEISVAGKESKFEITGPEYVPFDFQRYLANLGGKNPKTIAELTKLVGEDPFRKDGVFDGSKFPSNYWPYLKDPSKVPDMSKFAERREIYLNIINQVMDQHKLDALVYPQMIYETPLLNSKDDIKTTTNIQINIAGLPGVTVPAGYYASGSPFSIIFMGRQWDEGKLLALAYDYEQATKLRKAPVLVDDPAALSKTPTLPDEPAPVE